MPLQMGRSESLKDRIQESRGHMEQLAVQKPWGPEKTKRDVLTLRLYLGLNVSSGRILDLRRVVFYVKA